MNTTIHIWQCNNNNYFIDISIDKPIEGAVEISKKVSRDVIKKLWTELGELLRNENKISVKINV